MSYERESLKKGNSGADGILAQAKDWEKKGEHSRAIDMYLKVTPNSSENTDELAHAWEKAVYLTMKFVPSRAEDVTKFACERLAEIKYFAQSAELYLGIEMGKETIDMFIEGELWAKAKKCAADMAPNLEGYVEERYVAFLKQKGKADQAWCHQDFDDVATSSSRALN